MYIVNPLFIPDNAITQSNLKKPCVGTQELIDQAVTEDKIADVAFTSLFNRFQAFNSNGTFIAPRTGDYFVSCKGAGGAGGSGSDCTASAPSRGMAGMGGAEAQIKQVVVSLNQGDNVSVTIGEGVVSDNGQDTTFSTYVTGLGGQKGADGSGYMEYQSSVGIVCSSLAASSGQGAGSGAGGDGAPNNAYGLNGSDAKPNTGAGGGAGSGSSNSSSGSAYPSGAGGKGGSGYCIIQW